MRMRLLVYVTTILLAGAASAGAQQTCPDPNTCAGCNLPAECCQSGVGGLLVYECASKPPNFVVSDKEGGGSIEVELTAAKGVAASFSVAGLTVNNLTIGNATLASFTIGSSSNSARFTTSDGGQCVGVSNLSGLVFPNPIVVANRALTLSKSNPFFCRSAARDIICFQVKGQVGAPFPALACLPDRVEYACGIVT
jgi:hypothetical protein